MQKGKKTILVVDNDSEYNDFLMGLLGDECTLLTAKNGHSAITTAMNNTPHLILLHVSLSDMPGFAVARALQHIRETKNIPVIFIANQNTPPEKIQGLDDGDYLLKSYSADDVKRIIMSLIYENA